MKWQVKRKWSQGDFGVSEMEVRLLGQRIWEEEEEFRLNDEFGFGQAMFEEPIGCISGDVQKAFGYTDLRDLGFQQRFRSYQHIEDN